MTCPQRCSVEDCRNNAERAGLCSAHRLRKRLGIPGTTLRHYGQSPWEALQRAAVEYSDACAEDDGHFSRAADVLRKAALRYARHLLARRTENLPARQETGARVGHPGQEQAGEGRRGDA